jgi:1,2-diacylglycerol 3-alpha-glucosyltransferase
MARRSIVQVTLWNSLYLGNFMLSQIELARAVEATLGLGTHCVLGPGADGLPGLRELDAAGLTWSILPREHRRWRAHLDEVVRERDAALMHTHFTAADLAAAASAHAAGVPCVWNVATGISGYPLRKRVTDLYKMRFVARRRVARIVTVSRWLGELALRRGAAPEQVEVLPNALLIDRFAELPPRAQARERFGIEQDAVVALLLGWWPDVKGVDVFLDALARIVAKRPQLRALLVGEELMREFLAERLPEEASWLRTTGFVEDPAWLFAAADVFVSASRHEGQSTAVGEALAAGLPEICSDIPGTEMWKAAPGVLTFPSEDAGALAAQLELLLAATPAERSELGSRNRQWVRGEFSVEAWCERLCALYGGLIGAARPPISATAARAHEHTPSR